MIASLYDTIGPASWILLGVCLVALEVLVPGLSFLWVGLAALAVGCAAVFVDLAWPLQIVVFLAASCAAVFLGRLGSRRRAGGQGGGA